MDQTPLMNVLKQTPNRGLARFAALIAKRLFTDGVPDWLATIIERLDLVSRGWDAGSWDFEYEALEALRAQRASGEARWHIAATLIGLIDAIRLYGIASEEGPLECETPAEFTEALVRYQDEAVEAAIEVVTLASTSGIDAVDLAEMYARMRWPGVARRDPDRFDAAVAALAVGYDDVARSIIYRHRARV